jgi:hypothetical protein
MKAALALLAFLLAAPASADLIQVCILRDPAGAISRRNCADRFTVTASAFSELRTLKQIRRARRAGAHICARRLHGDLSTGRKAINRTWRCYDGSDATRAVPAEE